MAEFLTPSNDSFLELSQEDELFSLEISLDYSIPHSDVRQFMGELRYYLNAWNDSSESKYSEFFKFDTDINRITVSTNKGIVDFNYPEPMFFLCSDLIRKLKAKYEKLSTRSSVWNLRNEKEFAIEIIKNFVEETSINKITQRRIIIGKCLIYFKIGTLLKKEKFNEEKKKGKFIETQDYNKYLNQNVKSLLKKFPD